MGPEPRYIVRMSLQWQVKDWTQLKTERGGLKYEMKEKLGWVRGAYVDRRLFLSHMKSAQKQIVQNWNQGSVVSLETQLLLCFCPTIPSVGVSILLASSWSKMAAGAAGSVLQEGSGKKRTKGQHKPTHIIDYAPFKEASPKSHPTTSTYI